MLREVGNGTSRWSAEWFQSVLDAVSDLILVKGDRSKLLWANRAFLEYYGMTNEQLQDLVDAPHSDPDDTIQYVKDDHQVYTTGQVLDIPAEPVTDAAGNVRYFHTIKHPLFNDAGQVVRTVGVSRRLRSESVVAESSLRRSEQKSSLSELRATRKTSNKPP